MVEGQGAEVLVLHGDQAAGPGDPDHLAEDGSGVRDVEKDGHREDTVEAVGGEAEPRAVAHGMDEARSEAARAREPPRGLGHHVARVHPDDHAPRAEEGGGIAGDDAGARPDLQHALAAPDLSEAEKPAAQSPLGGRPSARFQVLDVAVGLPLPVDGPYGSSDRVTRSTGAGSR